MLNRLFNLYNSYRDSSKTPLEDFTTECLVGVLESNSELKNSFTNFLKLPNEGKPYYIKPQKFYNYEERPLGCKIDIVIKGKNVLCFIENKVESQEGTNQLFDYGKILSREKANNSNLTTFLVYCTKYYDSKDEDDFSPHTFLNVRWHEIASNVLASFKSDLLPNYFLNFLKTHKMAHELAISTIDLLVMENFADTFSILESYLEKVRPEYEKLLNKKILNKTKGIHLSQTYKSIENDRNHPRYIYNIKDILNGKGASDFNFGFYFGNPRLYIGMYIEDKNNAYNQIIENETNIKDLGITITHATSDGIVLKIEKDLYTFIGTEDAEKKIVKWFKEGFKIFQSFFQQSNCINWNKDRINI